MTTLQIEILLLGVMSMSATFFGYILFSEYARIKHLHFIKSIITLREDEINDLLEEKKRQESKENSPLAKLQKLMRHAGIEFHYLVFLLIVTLFCSSIGFLVCTLFKALDRLCVWHSFWCSFGVYGS